MYTDYHAETYFLEIPHKWWVAENNREEMSQPVLPGDITASSGTLLPEGTGPTVSSLTPVPPTPANNGDDQ
jgi:hypothetical protein